MHNFICEFRGRRPKRSFGLMNFFKRYEKWLNDDFKFTDILFFDRQQNELISTSTSDKTKNRPATCLINRTSVKLQTKRIYMYI